MRKKIDYVPTFLGDKVPVLVVIVLVTEVIVMLKDYLGLFANSPWNVLAGIVLLGNLVGWCLVNAALMKGFENEGRVATLAKANFILSVAIGFFICIMDWFEDELVYAYGLGLLVVLLALGGGLAIMIVSLLLGARLQKHFDGNAKEVGKWMIVYNLLTVVASLVTELIDAGSKAFWVVFLASIYVVWKYCNALGNLLGKPDEETNGVTE